LFVLGLQQQPRLPLGTLVRPRSSTLSTAIRDEGDSEERDQDDVQVSRDGSEVVRVGGGGESPSSDAFLFLSCADLSRLLAVSSSLTLPQAGEVSYPSDSLYSTIPTPSKVTSSSSSTVFSSTLFVLSLVSLFPLLPLLLTFHFSLLQIGRSFLLSLNAFHRLAYRRLSEQRLVGIASERDPLVRRALAEARRNGEFQRSGEEEEESNSSPVVLNGLGVEGLNLGPM